MFPAKFIESINGWVSLAEAQALYAAASTVSNGCIVEVGACEGRATVALSLGAPCGWGAMIFAVDPHEEFTGAFGSRYGPENRKGFYEAMIAIGGGENVHLTNLSSEAISPGWNELVGMLLIDGDPSYEGVSRDWECWQPHLVARAILAFANSTDERYGPCKLVRELKEAGQLSDIYLVESVTFARHVKPSGKDFLKNIFF